MEYKKPQKNKETIVNEVLTVESMEMVPSLSFTAVSIADDISPELQISLARVLDTLKQKGFKFNHNNDKNDVLTQFIYKRYNLLSDIYLPFKSFNKEALTNEDGEEINPTLAEPSMKAHRVAAKYKYNKELDESGAIRYNGLSEKVKLFSARNVHLILGSNVASKVKFLITMRPDTAESDTEVDYKTVKGDVLPLKLSRVFEIPVFNISKTGRVEELIEYINTL